MTHRVRRVLETALYFDDLPRAAGFYGDLLGGAVLTEDARLVALDMGSGTVLLLFKRGATVHEVRIPGGTIPAHDGAGPIHVAFAIDAEELSLWESRLAGAAVAIEHRVQWPRGGTSLYFRDFEGHSLELATPGVWETY